MPAATQVVDTDQIPLTPQPGLNQKVSTPDALNTKFYTPPLLSQRLATLNNMVGGRSQIIVVTGEPGSGKTTLVNQFMTGSDLPWQMSRIRLKSRHRFASRMLGRLNNLKIYIAHSDGMPSVIIDDAHQLNPRALKALLQWAFSQKTGPRLQSLLLLADTQMRKRYSEIATYLPDDAVIDKVHMTPLTEEQTAAYLRHRMQHAGHTAANPFSVNQVRIIHRTALGWPGLINREANRLLKKETGTPPMGSTLGRRMPSFFRIKNFCTKRVGFEYLKRVINLDPTPWVP